MKIGKYDEAKNQLQILDLADEFVRKFFVECILQTEDFDLALKIFTEPNTDEEFIAVLNASIQLNNKIKMKEFLGAANKFASNNPAIKQLTQKIEALLK